MSLHVFALLCCFFVASVHVEGSSKPQAESWNPVSHITAESAHSLFIQPDRHQSLLVMVTSQCTACAQLGDQFAALADWYQQHKSVCFHDLQFISVNADAYRFESAPPLELPFVMYFPASLQLPDNSTRSFSSMVANIPREYQYNVRIWGVSAYSLQKFVSVRARAFSPREAIMCVPSLSEAPTDPLLWMAVVAIGFMCLASVRVVLYVLPWGWFSKVVQSAWAWFVACAVCVIVCAAGSLFAVLRQVPFMVHSNSYVGFVFCS
jgi:hypothetical protein